MHRCINFKRKIYLGLDNDDMFFNEDIFDYIYKISKKNFYIIDKILLINNYNNIFNKIREHPLSRYPNNLILYQPKLGLFPITRNGHFEINDIYIWGKYY